MPNLTAKELGALEDQLSAGKLMIKKYTDPQIKTQCEQIAGRHQNHFDRLMGYLG